MPATVARCLVSEYAASTTAPAIATQNGSISANDVTTKPTSVATSTTTANFGTSVGSLTRSLRDLPELRAEVAPHHEVLPADHDDERREHQGAENSTSVSPVAPIANRLVRLAIGSSSDDEFARCPAA